MEVYVNKRLCFILALAAAPVALHSQAPPAASSNPIAASEKGFYTMVSGEVVAAAEKMPEQNYSFKPTPEVRSFGSTAAGEPEPMKDIEKTKTSKADLLIALKDAVAYCNKVYAGMTDAQGSQMVKVMNYDLARLTVLSVNTAHTDEHYGNMVTYLRLKGIVPPSSEKRASQGEM
jgi:hypothetical protein